MAAPGTRRFPLSSQEQSATVVPEAASAEERRQQVSSEPECYRHMYKYYRYRQVYVKRLM